jgi:type I restriction enzyme S subunit
LKPFQHFRLEEVCTIEYGNRVVRKRDGGSGYPVYGGGGATFEMDTFNRENRLVIARFGMSEQCTRIVNGKFFLNDSGLTLSPRNECMTQWFLDYQLLSLNDQIYALGKGTAQKNLDVAGFRGLTLYVPSSLEEQKRIVALLDEAFEALATAKANAEQNLQNARAIFESHLQSVFSQRGPGWVEKRLEEVCELQNGFAFKSSTFKPYGFPILRISNIQEGRIDSVNRIVFFDPNDYRENLDRYRIVKGDLLIAMSGATTGKLGFNTEDKVYYLNQRVGKFEPTDRLDKHFLYYFLSTKVEENLAISVGTAQPNLSTEQIKGFILPLPSVGEQKRIVDGLDALSAETQRLARLYKGKLAALDELKMSLLHKAFNGEL